MSSEIFLKGHRPYLWIIGIGFLLYAQTLLFGFTNFDDDILILNNYSTLHSFSNIAQVFGEDVFRNNPGTPHFYYRPMLIVSLMFDAQFGGLSPFMYHFTNILLHLLAGCLLFIFFEKLKYKKELSLFFSIIFTVHPVLAQAVAWVPGRNDSLLAVFVIAAFIFFLNFLETKKWPAGLLHLLFFILALFTKETALMLPLLCLAYIHLILKEKVFTTNILILMSGWLITFVFWFLLRQGAISNPVNFADAGTSLCMFLPAVIPYLGKILLPFNLSVIPILKDLNFDCGLVAILFIFNVLIFTKERRNNYITFGLLWFFLFLLPSFIRKDPTGEVIDLIEHRIYLSMIGFGLLLLETDLLKNLDLMKKRSFIVCAQIVLVFSFITFNHSVIFKNSQGFWENAVRYSPHLAVAHWKLANDYVQAGLKDKAELEYKKSIEITYWQESVHNNLGVLYKDKNLLKEAEAEFITELKINPGSKHAYYNLGLINFDRKNYPEAIRYFDEAIKRGAEVGPEIQKTLAPYRR